MLTKKYLKLAQARKVKYFKEGQVVPLNIPRIKNIQTLQSWSLTATFWPGIIRPGNPREPQHIIWLNEKRFKSADPEIPIR